MRLKGIIDFSMDNFLCVRGFAKMIDLANISEADDKIQRDLIEEHSGEMQEFLTKGQFTFFPEVILCTSMSPDNSENEKVSDFYSAIQAEQGKYRSNINKIKYWVKRNIVKQENNSNAFDITQTVIIEFEKELICKNKFLRIDGNHRLSAVDENSSFASRRTPFCLLLFRNDIEKEKFCRALFYNINAKQIPLRMEQNLKVIIEGESAFNDDILKNDPSFGFNYYLTRKVTQSIDLTDVPFVNSFISNDKYTYFVEVFDLLIKNGSLKENDQSVGLIKTTLVEINESLKKSQLMGMPNNYAIIGAYTYYELEDKNKATAFLKWAKNNCLTDISNLHIQDVINIFDKIHTNCPKKIFISMQFGEETKDTWSSIKEAADKVSSENNIEILITKVDEHRDGYSDQIYNRIIRGINDSDLVIADLSFGNKNVHHEIGFAYGMGRKVLLIYQTRKGVDSKSEIGSNISMHDQLRFNSYTDLKEKLKEKLTDYFL